MTELTHEQEIKARNLEIKMASDQATRDLWLKLLLALAGAILLFLGVLWGKSIGGRSETPVFTSSPALKEGNIDRLDMEEMKQMVAAASGMGAGQVMSHIEAKLIPHIDTGNDKILAAIKGIKPTETRIVYREKKARPLKLAKKRATKPMVLAKKKEWKETINGEVLYLEKFEPDRECPKGYQHRQPKVCYDPKSKKIIFL